MFLKAVIEVATTSCQQNAYETHAGMLDGVVGVQMILLTISYVRLSVSILELGSLMSIDDKSGVGRKTVCVCRCARFLLMLWPFSLIYFPEKDNRPHFGENLNFWHISPLEMH